MIIDELKTEINNLPSHLGWTGHGAKVMVAKDSVLELVRQLEEPQKAVVPQFVAEWIEYVKKDRMVGSITYALYHSTLDYSNMDAVELWREPWENQEVIARAWLDGYEVEREKLYTVEIPNGQPFVRGKESGIVYVSQDLAATPATLTESEIRKDFDWAWQFAKEVG